MRAILDAVAGDEATPTPRAPAHRRGRPATPRGAAPAVAAGLAATLAMALAGCATNPVTGESQLILMSEEQEERIDEEAARQVEAQIGLVDDPALAAYVNELGQALAAKSPRQDVRYHFHVVAMDEPNAFALPAGHIYVSRGLLALLNDESELANVLGHEIGHVAARHAAQRDTLMKVMTVLNTVGMIGAAAGGATVNGNGGPAGNPGLYAYSRRQESQADEIGQDLAVATGIDPAGMAGLLRSLDAYERMERGFSRRTGYFDSHPAARERAAEAATAAQVRSFEADFRIASSRADFLERLSGLSVGPPASEGVVEGSRFVHPDLGFVLRFPQGWKVHNEHAAVYGVSPTRDAIVVLELQGEGDDPAAAAHVWAQDAVSAGATGSRDAAGPVRIGGLDAYRVRGDVATAAGRRRAEVTWIHHDGMIYRLSGFTLDGRFDRYAGVFRAFPRSFRPITEDERTSVTELRMRVVEARAGETLAELGRRTGNEWDPLETAVYNGVAPARPLEAGQQLKIAVRVPYAPHRERPESEPDRVPSATSAPELQGAGPAAGSLRRDVAPPSWQRPCRVPVH